MNSAGKKHFLWIATPAAPAVAKKQTQNHVPWPAAEKIKRARRTRNFFRRYRASQPDTCVKNKSPQTGLPGDVRGKVAGGGVSRD
jgi:hypothetical protein